MLQVALRRSRGKNCLSSMTLNLETVRVSKLRKGHYYIQATADHKVSRRRVADCTGARGYLVEGTMQPKDCEQNDFFIFSRQNKFFQLNDIFTSDSSLLNSGSEYAIELFKSQSSIKMWFVEVYNIGIRKVYENDF